MASVHDRIISLTMELFTATELLVLSYQDAGFCRGIALAHDGTLDGQALIKMLWPEEEDG